MKTVETEKEGLKRGFMLTIGADEIAAKVESEVKRMAPQVRMPGFRPGKVPPNLIRKMHGEALAAEALNTAVQEGVQTLLAEQKIRPAMQPQVELDEGYAPGKDAEVKVSVEALPDIPAPKIDALKLERLSVEPDDTAVDAQLDQLLASQKRFDTAPEGHAAQTGDQVVIDFVGTVGGTAFEGGTGQAMPVEIGSGALIPGFEDGLVGIKAGESRDVNVTFPEDYPAENLKGKAAVFAITATEVKIAGESKADDEFAKTLGLESIDKLKGLLRDQHRQELNGLTRTHMKRRLLDQLAESHDFPVPQTMVDAEYENIMQQLRHEAEHEADSAAALAEIESEAADYRRIAERRVRLGLLLSEIGNANGVEISQQEMNRLIGQAASQYQPKDRERFIQYVQQDPVAAAQLRAPLYEDKVVDYLFGKAEISDRTVSRAELEADLESEEGHVHGPGCGHDHVHAEPAPKKAKAKPAKAKAADVEVSAEAKPADAEASAEADAPKPAKPVKDGAGRKAPEAKPAQEKPAKAEKKPAAKKKA